MRIKKVRGPMIALGIFAVIFLGTVRSAAGQATTLHSFRIVPQRDGLDFGPTGSIVIDGAGNLYGTVNRGGTGHGTVFELMPNAAAGWDYKTLHTFSGSDGDSPSAALIFDAAGNLYGTTASGGPLREALGTVFELSPTANGNWTHKILHTFTQVQVGRGVHPAGALIFDGAGNLYGTTVSGGAGCDCGTVFKLSPSTSGDWGETELHRFNIREGGIPFSELIFDAAGNLYGTTVGDTTMRDHGIVFELSPPPSGGKWTFQILHKFKGDPEGSNPSGGLVFDAAGNLYGATTYGGINHSGTVFELSPVAGGGWKEQVLHNFGFGDGLLPYGRLLLDSSGNLYGTTSAGAGASGACFDRGCGTVFELSPNGDGPWTGSVLLRFGSAVHGYAPVAGLIFDAAGNLYGTTEHGGAYGATKGHYGGTVFQLKH
jgi:uncharacterized repeat protein (TIGR03803 family)